MGLLSADGVMNASMHRVPFFALRARRREAARVSIPQALRTVYVVALFVALAACGGRPKGVLTPVEDTSASASEVNMLVATTRSRSDVPGEMFSGERARAPSFAEITVSIPQKDKREIGQVAWPKKLPPDPEFDFATSKANEIGTKDAKNWLSASVVDNRNRSVLVFVHGFNTRFEDAVYRFAQIVEDSGVDSAPVLVTWPSRGSLTAYGYDRESTNYTRNALESLFQYLANDPEIREVSVLAHSMGNWLALEALRQMAIRNGRLPAKFKNVMLAAPDVDVDVFRSQIADMGADRPQFTLFVSRDDRALAVSRRVWGDVSRLGAIDPDAQPYKQELEANRIRVIDLTKVKAGDDLHHTKFAQSPEIVQLIGKRISEGQVLADQRIGLGDHIVAHTTEVAEAAGTTAGLILTAPVAAVDPHSRDNYSSHFEGLLSPTTPGLRCEPRTASKQDCSAARDKPR